MNNILEKRPVVLEIDLDNMAHNFLQVKRIIDKNVKIMAIVKANSYGHGSVQCAKTFIENGADYLGVSTLSEGIELRQEKINSNILVLSYIPRSSYNKLLEYDLIQTIYNFEDAKILSEIALKMNKIAKIHIKIDTGMSRLGFLPTEESFKQIEIISHLPNIFIDGTYSHFVMADEVDKTYTREQYKNFMKYVSILNSMGIDTGIKHISSSAAIIDLPEYNLDMVRPGIILYGHYPSNEVNKDRLYLKPTMTLKATISNIKQVPIGTGISYSHIFKTRRSSIIATLPIGYADGFSRGFIGKGSVFVKNQCVPVLGKICMDQMMIDVTDVPDLNLGDEVILFGYKDKEYPTLEQMANILGTINYEVFCSLGRRIPRVYIKSDKIVSIVDYLRL